MTGAWETTAKTVSGAVVSLAIGFLVFGTLGWDRLAIASIIGMFVSGAIAFALAVAYVIWLRDSRQDYLRRRPLSDKQFIALLQNPDGIEPWIASRVRQLAARRFRSIGGDRFFPADRLEEDLHLADAAPWELEDFWVDLADYLEIGEQELLAHSEGVRTFGNIVELAHRLFKSKRIGSSNSPKDALWDRGID